MKDLILKNSEIKTTGLPNEYFLKGVSILKAHFPRLNLPDYHIKMMFLNLRDLTIEEFTKGIKTFCRAHEDIYPGTNIVAKIRKYSKGHLSRPTALEAWGIVQERINLRKTPGRWDQSMNTFQDEIIDKLVKSLGGLKELCMTDNLSFSRHEFIKAYDSCVENFNFEDTIK